MQSYRERIALLIAKHPLGIDADIKIEARTPNAASSEFLTNKAQGDWAEQLVISAVNGASAEYVALPYGHSENIAAGEIGRAHV